MSRQGVCYVTSTGKDVILDDVRLTLHLRDGNIKVVYEDGRETLLTGAEYAEVEAHRRMLESMRFSGRPWAENHCDKNPCAEIALGGPQWVSPMLQAQMMNGYRRRAGKEPFTASEMEALIDSLYYQQEKSDAERQGQRQV